jgi:hypothetical protein
MRPEIVYHVPSNTFPVSPDMMPLRAALPASRVRAHKLTFPPLPCATPGQASKPPAEGAGEGTVGSHPSGTDLPRMPWREEMRAVLSLLFVAGGIPFIVATAFVCCVALACGFYKVGLRFDPFIPLSGLVWHTSAVPAHMREPSGVHPLSEVLRLGRDPEPYEILALSLSIIRPSPTPPPYDQALCRLLSDPGVHPGGLRGGGPASAAAQVERHALDPRQRLHARHGPLLR